MASYRKNTSILREEQQQEEKNNYCRDCVLEREGKASITMVTNNYLGRERENNNIEVTIVQ